MPRKSSKSEEKKPKREKKQNHVPMITFTAYKIVQIPLYHEHYCALMGKCSCETKLSGFDINDNGHMVKKKYKRLPATLHCLPGKKYTIPKQLFEQIPQLTEARRRGKIVVHMGKLT